MNVLVVADDPNLASLWGGVLTNGGHDVFVASTGAMALVSLRNRTHDLVVLDLCIKGCSRVELTKLATRRNPSCKVVLVSGTARHSRDALYATSPAVSAALRKPVDIEDLIEACETASRGVRTAPAAFSESQCVAYR